MNETETWAPFEPGKQFIEHAFCWLLVVYYAVLGPLKSRNSFMAKKALIDFNAIRAHHSQIGIYTHTEWEKTHELT